MATVPTSASNSQQDSALRGTASMELPRLLASTGPSTLGTDSASKCPTATKQQEDAAPPPRKSHFSTLSAETTRDSPQTADTDEQDRVVRTGLANQLLAIRQHLKFRMAVEESDSVAVRPADRVVTCSCEVLLIRDINPVHATFFCRFYVYLDWIQEEAKTLPIGEVKDGTLKTGIPEIGLQNALHFNDQQQNPEVVCNEKGHVRMRILFQATMQMDLNMRLFPFDRQRLTLVLGLRARRDRDRALFSTGCTLRDQIRLDEWLVLGSSSFADRPLGRARVEFAVQIGRTYWYYVLNVLVTLLIITVLAFFGYLLDREDLFDRLRLGISTLFAQTTFKLSIESKLPKVAYATVFDRYSMICQLAVFAMIISNMVVASLSSSRHFWELCDVLDPASYGTIFGLWVAGQLVLLQHVRAGRSAKAVKSEARPATSAPFEASPLLDLAPTARLELEALSGDGGGGVCASPLARHRSGVFAEAAAVASTAGSIDIPTPADSSVWVSIRVWLLHDVDPISATFECKFTVFLEWVDERAVGLPEGAPLSAEKRKELSLRAPKLTPQNALESHEEESGKCLHILSSVQGRVLACTRYHARLQLNMDMQRFPFDAQQLPVQLVMARDEDADRSFVFRGCTLEQSASELDEWVVCGTEETVGSIDGAPSAVFQVLVARKSSYYMVSVLAVLFGISSLVFSLFIIDVDAYADQGKIFMPLLMTSLMFKLSTASKLPKVAKSTIFDRYVMACQTLFFATAALATEAKLLHSNPDFGDIGHYTRRYGAISLLVLWTLCNAWLIAAWYVSWSSTTMAMENPSEEKQRPRRSCRYLPGQLHSMGFPMALPMQLSPVLVQIRVQHIHSVNPTTATFHCEFLATLVWQDPAAKDLNDGLVLPKNWQGQPTLMIQNAVAATVTNLNSDGGLRVISGTQGLLGREVHVRAQLQMCMEMAHFPFDEQVLAVVLSLPDFGDRHRYLSVDFVDGADKWVDGTVHAGEWIPGRSFTSDGRPDGLPCAAFGVRLQRSSRYYVQHLATICLFSGFALVVYAHKVAEFASRGKILVGVLLVQIVAKLSVASKLPRIACTTVFDRCALNSLAMNFCVFWSTAITNSLWDANFLGITNAGVETIDTILGILTVGAWVLANVYLVLRVQWQLWRIPRRRRGKVPRRYRWGCDGSEAAPAMVHLQVAEFRRALAARHQQQHCALAVPDATAASSHEAPPLKASEVAVPSAGLSGGAVSLKVKLGSVSGIDSAASTFDCKFHVFFGWLDEAAVGLPCGKRLKLTAADKKALAEAGKVDHPRIVVTNAIAKMSENYSDAEVVDGETGQLTCWVQYHVRLHTSFDMRSFPFDTQRLEVVFELQPRRDGLQRYFQAGTCDDTGLDSNNDNWHLLRAVFQLSTSCSPNCASIVMLVRRDASFYVINVMSVLFVLSSLVFTFYLLPPADLAGRFIDMLKIVLTQTTFRLAVEARLPKVPHWTPFDLYLVSCQLLFLLIAGSHLVVGLRALSGDEGGEEVAPSGDCSATDTNIVFFAGMLSVWLVWNLGFVLYSYRVRRREHRRASEIDMQAIDTSSTDLRSLERPSLPSTQIPPVAPLLPLDALGSASSTNDLVAPQLISVAFKIWLIRNIDPIKGTFDCKFRVFLEWLDEDAVGLPKGSKARRQAPDVSITNAIKATVVDQSKSPEVVCSDTGHLAVQMLFQATLNMNQDVQFFPFDCQWLMINLSLREGTEHNRSFIFQYCEVDTQLAFDEWTVHHQPAFSAISKEVAPSIQDTVICGVIIRRCAWYYVVNIMGMLCLMTLLCFSIYAIYVDQFWERAEVFLGIFPLVVVFKLSAQGRLPRVNYSTAFDQYVLTCQRFFLAIVGGCVAMSLAISIAEWVSQSCAEAPGVTPPAVDSVISSLRFMEFVSGGIFALLFVAYNMHFAWRCWRLQQRPPPEVLRCSIPLQLQDGEFLAALSTSLATQEQPLIDSVDAVVRTRSTLRRSSTEVSGINMQEDSHTGPRSSSLDRSGSLARRNPSMVSVGSFKSTGTSDSWWGWVTPRISSGQSRRSLSNVVGLSRRNTGTMS